MSVLVTTTFSQGAVFYAGETLSCTITFTNPILSSVSKPVKSSISTPIPVSANAAQPLTRSTPQPRTISSLASSTLAFLTRSQHTTPPPHSTNNAVGRKEPPRPLVLDQNDEEKSIPVELESPTPRSSIDTFLHPSPRSSMDSIASFRSSYQHNAARRYSSSPLKKPVSEHLLCGFAQVVGSFVADSSLINLNEFGPLKHHTMYNPQGGFGGGGGLMMAQSDSSLDTRTLPVFSTPPSILFVDLNLAPGETKKYTYKMQLPNDIPPSHRGKAIRFNYYLVVGAQRAPTAATAKPGLPTQGQVVQIRFRVLNHVSEDGSRPIYDLMNPVVRYKDEAVVDEYNSTKAEEKPVKQPKKPAQQIEERKAFMDYVNELFENSTQNHTIHEITRRESDAYEERSADEQILDKSCSQVVSRITHRSRKAMYDICKNNQRVAKLHLIKTAHRLGEPVIGVLDFSEAILSTYKISIFLESCESVEDTISLRTPQHISRVSRKTHSDFHSFCLDNRRLSFSLPIPATASPEFQTTGVSLKYFLKFEFITSIDNQPPFIPIIKDEKHIHHQCLQDIEVSTFDCQIPLTIYGSPGGVDRALYGRPHTFRVQ
ncbi:Golgi membrane exchange factor (Ric1p-Rgp1p) subunit [Mucor circinelloides]